MEADILGLVPARGGSSRVERKNIRDVGGKPLIAHTIEQAQKSETISRTVVSTDNEEIARVAREYGGDTPFIRPTEFATDTASSASVVTHALDQLEGHGEEFDSICLLQPTSPLRSATDIDQSMRKFHQSDAHTLLSVSEFTEPPQYAVQRNGAGYLEERYDPTLLFSDSYVREQDINDLLYPNGAIFVSSVDSWRENKTFYSSKTEAFKMPPRRSLQIDEEWELELVDAFVTH
ncbi:acylneuraminate cytidylyltransferase family protein [Halobacterium salinarum]|uniref:acylneuraminate cytidylyltransferase family protein n=1 Tax=Halobacterium TaxID=2239 RepID=UPI001F478A51|nr:acylneuraminate cytidylyltransferase family protein [Halobacterium salinarum]MCF2165523.1 acylneuraminate cytidylyltransferase family protein [Halobacterium salinarum]MCF2168692.1 acylneuraminate cytidylyltransferase family protein [Halobacterium salinarum]MDL0124885.1 acylneuraminate cytidylyltransferase family protein [Halobacterium salinarum]MDL0138306.1 acylneuraminate cytidylyltransferase family protein [Halobacterium salinarum]